MLRISKLADYATVVMAFMGQAPFELRSAQEIATAVGLELPTVSKVLKRLARGRLVVSQRGAKGGYRLARVPGEISVAEIIDVIEDYPMGLTECSSVAGSCARESACAVRANWQRISAMLRATLQEVTLEELARPLPQAVDAGSEHFHSREVAMSG